ncbi:MAG: LuxR C-terminal-related transcriptional regulator [Acidimicrobiia bacterium]|nr:LuxR C-terminal-related transcriptional regulator [Acidimicrobiia bacterium]
MTSADVLEAARTAFERRDWDEAHRELVRADEAGGLGPDDLERLAIACYLTGHDEASTAAWIRAHRARLDAAEWPAAVRCAFWLGFGLIQRGEMAPGGGWIGRAGDLVDEHDLDCVEAGYLLVPAALTALDGGDDDVAAERFGRALEIGRRFGDHDLGAMGVLGTGQVLLDRGRAVEGLARFDEAMASVTAGEVSPVVAGIVYCAVIDACQQCFDVRRAGEWTDALGRWCDDQPGLVPYRGQCLVHRSQVLQLRGAWTEALDEAHRAEERLNEPPHPALGMAHYQLGELHRLRGELADAEEAYRSANEAGRLPQPGLALLRLAQGRVADAASAIEWAVAETHDAVTRARMLPARVEIMLAAERIDDARHASSQLDDLAATTGFPYLHAAAAHARGEVLLATGEPQPALESLLEAGRHWQDVDARYEAARTRVAIAAACAALGDHDTAELEREAARRTFAELGADPTPAGLADRRRDTVVSTRELDVLRLVAAGRTNREIADELVISPKTVERHLSNIFTKLGVSNRAAATAYAYDHDLV